MPILILLQNELPEIEKKIAEAPDSSYEIGIFIGTMLPFVVLVILAYLLFSYMRRNKDHNALDD